MWTTVASQAKYFPSDQAIRVVPSGLLPLVLNRPAGSLVLGTPALFRAHHMNIIYGVVEQRSSLGFPAHKALVAILAHQFPADAAVRSAQGLYKPQSHGHTDRFVI